MVDVAAPILFSFDNTMAVDNTAATRESKYFELLWWPHEFLGAATGGPYNYCFQCFVHSTSNILIIQYKLQITNSKY